MKKPGPKSSKDFEDSPVFWKECYEMMREENKKLQAVVDAARAFAAKSHGTLPLENQTLLTQLRETIEALDSGDK